ncbi:hypothetical protein BGZ58_007790 [Dissophora ornata]|nr:hypothetical protein BGZ58_007790 [Dissophora ornata]
MSWSLLSTLVILSVLLLTSFTPSAQVSAAAGTGFCGDCQTFAYAIAPCGSTFTSTDIEINGTYIPPQSASKCICSDTMQKVLWACARCELLAFGAHSQPPQAYQTQCIAWGMTAAEWTAAYTGTIAPGTSAITGSTTGATTTAVTGTTTVAVGTATTTTAAPVAASSGTTTNGTLTGTAAALPSGSSDSALSGGTSESSGGPNGTAIGISVGIIGVAAVAGAIAVFMMKRNRRRHEPLELDGTYVGLDDQWEKPRPQSPPMMPAPIASGAPIASRGPMQSGHRPSPFESRPGGGGSVAGGYDGQYDQYDQYDQQYDHNYAHHQGGGGGGYEYNHGGYQGYEYGYENTVPTSGPYHGGNGSDGGHYQ